MMEDQSSHLPDDKVELSHLQSVLRSRRRLHQYLSLSVPSSDGSAVLFIFLELFPYTEP